MSAGSQAQAKRCSSSNASYNNSGSATLSGATAALNAAIASIKPTVTINGLIVEEAKDPNRDQLISELSKKRVLNCTLKEKTETIIAPCMEKKKEIIQKAKELPTNGNAISSQIDLAIPSKLGKKTLSGKDFGECAIDIHAALKAYINAATHASMKVLRSIQIPFDKLDEAIKLAISHFKSDQDLDRSKCLPILTDAQLKRKYKVDGYLPTDTSLWTCIACGHGFVDEPNSNKTVYDTNRDAMQAYQAEVAPAQAEAQKKGTVPKRTPKPKAVQAFLQCHCHQMYCTAVGVAAGSSCPINCKVDGVSCGVDEKGNCACPICKCPCKIAYTLDAPQKLKVQEDLNAHDQQKMEAINKQTSQSTLSFLLKMGAKNAVQSTMAHGGTIPEATLESMASTAAAHGIAANFNPAAHRELLDGLRKDVGPPTTKVVMPRTVKVDGNEVSVFNTKAVGSSGNYCKYNNKLSTPTGEGKNPQVLPLKPYDEIHKVSKAVAKHASASADQEDLITFTNGELSEDEAMKIAMMESNKEQAMETPGKGNHSMPPPANPGSNQVIVLLDSTPPPAPAPAQPMAAPVAGAGHTPLINRVKKKAFQHMLKTTTVEDVDNPGAPPEIVAQSPLAHEAYRSMADRHTDPVGATFVADYEDNVDGSPSSQDAYESLKLHLKTVGHVAKKSKKN